MRRTFLHLAVFGILILNVGCSGMSVDDFKGSQPELKLEEYFAGKTKGFGMVLNRSGKPIRQFVVDMDGVWEGDEFVLREDFVFSDGEKTKREWRVRKLSDSSYEGRAGDVIGKASGKQAGNALHWKYTLKLPVKGTTWNIAFDDWMFLQPEGVLLNRASMSKWGIGVGEILISFKKL